MRHDKNQHRQLPLLLFLLLSLSMILGYGSRTRLPWFAPQWPTPSTTTASAPQPADWEKLNDIKDYIEDLYNGPVVDDVLMEGAIKGMVASLDGGGQYFNAREFADLIARPQRIRGTGIHLGVRNERITVIRVDEGSQGDKAGVMPGDIILKINNRVYDGTEIEAARNLMVSDDRRNITVSLLRGDDQIETRVRLRLLVDQSIRAMVHQEIGIVRLPGFTDGIAGELDRILVNFRAAGAKAVILDLRSLPSGRITEAVNVAAKFIPAGETVTSIRDTNGGSRAFLSQDGAFSDLPLVVLINGLSEGTAEFAAGALQQKAGATVIGETSLGEGRVFAYINLPEGEGIKLVTGYFILPDGQEIQREGIQPDVEVPGVPMYARNLIQPADLQMLRAIEEAGARIE